jgi:magnesium transporter
MQDWDRQTPTQIVTEMCGFVTILSGTFLLHKTKDMVDGMISCSQDFSFEQISVCNISISGIIGLPPTLPIRIPKHAEEGEGIPLRSTAEGIPLRSPRAADSFRST